MFDRKFPYYLSIGMTPEQYWDGDSMLAKYYREADAMRKEKANWEAWLQGMYFYDALGRVSPIMHAFAKKGAKARPYVEEPYPISEKAARDAETEKEKRNSQKGLRYMEAFAVRNNKQFETV